MWLCLEVDVFQDRIQVLSVAYNQVLGLYHPLTGPALGGSVGSNDGGLLWGELGILNDSLYSIHVHLKLSALPHHPIHQTWKKTTDNGEQV